MDFLKQPPVDDIPRVVESINRATQEMERITLRKSLLARSNDFILDGTGLDWILLPEWPLNSLASAKYIDANGAQETIVTSDAVLEFHGRITLFSDYFPWGTGNILLTANCGYDATADAPTVEFLTGWALDLTRAFYTEWQSGTAAAALVGQTGAPRPLLTAMINEAKSSLEPYRRRG